MIRRWLSALILLAAAGACSTKTCDDDEVPPVYRITLRDAATGETVCDANVVVSAHPANRAQNACVFVVTIPSYTDLAELTVKSDGYVARTMDLSTHYEKDDCGKPIPRYVTVDLEPRS